MIKKIGTEELRVGMYVCGMEKTPGKPLFFMNNILVKGQEDLLRIKGNGYYCIYIAVEDEPAVTEEIPAAPALEAAGPAPAKPVLPQVEEPAIEATSATEEAPGPVAEAPPARQARSISEDTGPVEFEKEVERAAELRNEAEGLVRDFLSNARLGKDIDTGKVTDTVDRMVSSVFRNQDALTSLARLKSFDDYTFAHSVNVCILSIALGRHMGLSREYLSDLGVGAILHDIGKMLVPEGILKKPAVLTDEEFGVMKRHAEYGSEVLSGTSGIKDASRLVAEQHHERFDGSGYGHRLSGGDIHLFARIAAVADVYDAMTSNRCYQRCIQPEEAMKKLYLMRGSHFEPQLVERLIKCLGVYPIGSYVELNTGELAIVKMINHAHPLQPRVLLLTDRSRKPCAEPFESDLKDEIGRWIVATMKPGDLPQIPALIA